MATVLVVTLTVEAVLVFLHLTRKHLARRQRRAFPGAVK